MGNLSPGGSFHGVTPGDVIREFYVRAREGGYVMDPDKGWTHTSGRDWGATARRFLGVPRAEPTP